MVLLAGVACTSTPAPDEAVPVPADELTAFIGAWQAEDWDKAGAATSSPGPAGQLLDSVTGNLDPEKLTITPGAWQQPDEATAVVGVQVDWTLPDAGQFTYDTTWTWTRTGAGEAARWRLRWEPTVIHPKLGSGQTLALRTTDSKPGVLVDRNDRQIVAPVVVVSVVVRPDEVKDLQGTAQQLANILKTVDPTATAESIVEGTRAAAKDVGYTVTNLRQEDFAGLQDELSGIPGVMLPEQTRNLPPTKDFARTVLSQVIPVADELMAGTDGWRIVSVDTTAAEVETLAEGDPVDGKKVALTLDSDLQASAEKALAAIPEQAMLVAIQPSTGELLTIAQNAAANTEGPLALSGQYPPGSTFKIVTATAAIDQKMITPDTQVPCPGQWTVDYRPIRNDNSFDLGTVTATTAFAKSCNTTFAELSTRMPDELLSATATQYGIGLDFVMPGAITLTGKVPVSSDPVQKAENGFGQGVVLVSPFSAALMAATAATDDMPTPTLIRGSKVTVDREAPARSAAARAAVRTFMRAVVTDGTAKQLAADGEVFAKTGTAEFTDEKGEIHAHAWTVGFRGDVAFAVLIVGGDSSKRTTAVAHEFLASFPG